VSRRRPILVESCPRGTVEAVLADPVEALILDLLEWLAVEPRPYSSVMDAWRTSCPRLPVWEDANDAGFIDCFRHEQLGTLVSLTPAGREFLAAHRPARVHSSKQPIDSLRTRVRVEPRG
jgi:hypothetical protein